MEPAPPQIVPGTKPEPGGGHPRGAPAHTPRRTPGGQARRGKRPDDAHQPDTGPSPTKGTLAPPRLLGPMSQVLGTQGPSLGRPGACASLLWAPRGPRVRGSSSKTTQAPPSSAAPIARWCPSPSRPSLQQGWGEGPEGWGCPSGRCAAGVLQGGVGVTGKPCL